MDSKKCSQYINNHFVEVRDLDALGIYLNEDPVKLFRNNKRGSWYRLRAGKKKADVKLPHVEIFLGSGNPEEIRAYFDSYYRDKMH